MNKRFISVIAICVSLIIVFGMTIYQNKQRDKGSFYSSYTDALPTIKTNENAAEFVNEDFSLDLNFTSHMPIVVIDMQGEEPPISTVWSNTEERYVEIEGLEPYVDGEIQVINGGTGEFNKLTDEPVHNSKIRIKRRGNTSMNLKKPQYLLKLVTDSGQDNEVSMLGMGEDHEWILNGYMVDKSMMRNYLAFYLASRILAYTPDSKYCEVVTKENETYKYQGVYLLLENIKQGVNRVDIAKYQSSEIYSSYLVRRDRYDENGLMLDTFATGEKLSYGSIELLYPKRLKVTNETIRFIEQDISNVESILYSDDIWEFMTYPDYIDVDSFVDYFLINEFLGNYDAGKNSTYMYKDVGGKLSIGPVWDFDSAFDNYPLEPMKTEVTAFQVAPWFDRLIKDKDFINKLEKRYAKLRRGIFSDENMLRLIDDISTYLGPAREREVGRWNKIYNEQHLNILEPYLDKDGEMIKRETNEYNQEIYRLKTVVKKHGAAIGERLALMHLSTSKTTNWFGNKALMFFIAVAVFVISSIYVNRN